MFPSLFHAHHSLYQEDIHFWIDLAAHYPGPILELGSGTGRVLLPLARAGYEVYGLDIDRDMLVFMQQNISSNLPASVFLFQADFTRFHLEKQFGLILLPCNTLSTLPAQARQSMLECVHDHLQPGGAFAASIPNPHLLRSLPAKTEPEMEDVFLDPENGEPVQISCSWKRTKTLFIIQWYYDRLSPDGRVQRYSTQVKHHLTESQVYLDEIANAGMHPIITYGDFDYSDFTPGSPYCIFLTSVSPRRSDNQPNSINNAKKHQSG